MHESNTYPDRDLTLGRFSKESIKICSQSAMGRHGQVIKAEKDSPIKFMPKIVIIDNLKTFCTIVEK